MPSPVFIQQIAEPKIFDPGTAPVSQRHNSLAKNFEDLAREVAELLIVIAVVVCSQEKYLFDAIHSKNTVGTPTGLGVDMMSIEFS